MKFSFFEKPYFLASQKSLYTREGKKITFFIIVVKRKIASDLHKSYSTKNTF